jgi:transposase
MVLGLIVQKEESAMKTESHRSPESVVREIKRKTRRKYNAEEKIRIVLEGLKGEESIAAICRHELWQYSATLLIPKLDTQMKFG